MARFFPSPVRVAASFDSLRPETFLQFAGGRPAPAVFRAARKSLFFLSPLPLGRLPSRRPVASPRSFVSFPSCRKLIGPDEREAELSPAACVSRDVCPSDYLVSLSRKHLL